MLLKYTTIIAVFIIGLLFYVRYAGGRLREGFSSYRCPNVLLQKGSEFFLFNSKLAEVPGVNPIRFATLEDYKEFLDWQRSQGIKCPVLYVQQSYDAQGNEIFQQRPDPFNPQGGLSSVSAIDANMPPTPPPPPPVSDTELLFDAAHDNPPYNWKMYPGYDEQNQYIGIETPLDKMEVDQTMGKYSDSPMDPNWGGPAYTQELVARGYYKGNEVYMTVP